MPRTDQHDPTRREFFRTFGRETVRQAGAVAGAAAELRRSSLEAARVLFDPDGTDTPAPSAIEESKPDATFRSAYRFTGSEIIALDTRELPHRVATIALTDASEVASAIRAGAINGGPVLAEIGAYALAIAARGAVGRPQTGRDQQVRAAADTLRGAKPEIHALTWGVDRVESVYLAERATDPTDLADHLQSEADSIASANASAHAEIGRAGAELINHGGTDTINLLMHGDMGPLSCGMVGMGTALVQGLRDAGRQVHVWVTDAAPSGEGRVAAYQLGQLDLPFTVLPDSAVGWLFNSRPVDALLLRGDRVANNGDCGVLLGGVAAAVLAKAANVPVYVLAPRAAHESAATLEKSATPTADVLRSELITKVVSA